MMEATMRKFAIVCLAIAVTALISGTIVTAGHNGKQVTPSQVATLSIDPTAITQAAGDLPTVQVNEPF
jgi:hypothetical protein